MARLLAGKSFFRKRLDFFQKRFYIPSKKTRTCAERGIMMTSKELAALCGVSRRAVHRALTGSTDIAEATREKILRIAKENDYVPSSAGHSLRTGRTEVLGLVVGYIQDSYFSNLTAQIIALAQDRGYQVMVSATEWNMEKEIQAFRTLLSQKVDGVIYLPTVSLQENQAILRKLIEKQFPLVTMDSELSGVSCVGSDYRQGFSEAVADLKCRFRRIGLILHRSDLPLKRTAFMDACREAGVEPDVIIASAWHPEDDNAQEYIRLIREHPETGVWIVSGEKTAIRMVRLLRNSGVRIPEETELVILNGVEWFRYLEPELPAIVPDLARLAEAMVSAVLGPDRTAGKILPMRYCRAESLESINNGRST